MQRLVKLNLANNKIKGMNIFTVEESFPNLKWLDVSNNKLTEIPAIKLPKLEYLDISHNKMEKINEQWTGHPNIRILKSIDNKFKSLAPFKVMPRLEELYMASNAMHALTGWETLPMLKKLHLRRNKIDKIDEELPELPSLEYLNLRSNKIPTLEVLLRLFQFPALKDINVMKNPVEQDASHFNVIMADVLRKSTKLERFCKVSVEESSKLEAIYLAQFRYEKEQAEAKAKAAEEAAKQGEDE